MTQLFLIYVEKILQLPFLFTFLLNFIFSLFSYYTSSYYSISLSISLSTFSEYFLTLLSYNFIKFLFTFLSISSLYFLWILSHPILSLFYHTTFSLLFLLFHLFVFPHSFIKEVVRNVWLFNQYTSGRLYFLKISF